MSFLHLCRSVEYTQRRAEMDRKGPIPSPSPSPSPPPSISTSRHSRSGSAGATMASASGRRAQNYTARAAAQRLAKAMASQSNDDDDNEDFEDYGSSQDEFNQFMAPSRLAPSPQACLLLGVVGIFVFLY